MEATRARLTVLFLLLVSLPVLGHWRDDSTMKIDLEGNEWPVRWRVPREVIGFADENGDGTLSAAEINQHREPLQRILRQGLKLTAGEQQAELELAAGREAGSETHVTVTLLFRWSEPVEFFDLHFGAFPMPDKLYGDDPPRCLAVVRKGSFVRTFVLNPFEPSLRFDLRPPSHRHSHSHSHAHSHDGVEHEVARSSLSDFLRVGLEHIAGGWDHLLFVFCLLLAAGGLWQVVKVVTAFTVAHSISLAAAVLGYVNLPSRWVEAAIAFSISVAAYEAFRYRSRAAEQEESPSGSALGYLAFAFGLIHGLGFASALGSLLDLHGTSVAVPLLGFNLGVELGQLAVVFVATPILLGLERVDRKQQFARATAVAIIVVGLALGFGRIFG